jgi:hypothetical protein
LALEIVNAAPADWNGRFKDSIFGP